ncbi:MAG: hypothetical protein PHY59_01010 [Methanobacterium sp.]|nr:hypothetical protein [Methanobacterium sp.]
MGYNKVISIFLLFIMAIFIMGVQPANAVKSEIKIYNYEGIGHEELGVQFKSDFSIRKGKTLQMGATLHINRGHAQLMRYIYFFVYDPTAELIFDDGDFTFLGVAFCSIYTGNWAPGIYLVKVVYPGSNDWEWPAAVKYLRLHII